MHFNLFSLSVLLHPSPGPAVHRCVSLHSAVSGMWGCHQGTDRGSEPCQGHRPCQLRGSIVSLLHKVIPTFIHSVRIYYCGSSNFLFIIRRMLALFLFHQVTVSMYMNHQLHCIVYHYFERVLLKQQITRPSVLTAGFCFDYKAYILDIGQVHIKCN